VSFRGLGEAITRVLPLVLMVCVLATLTRLAAYPLSNPDTFLHLRLGEEFLSGAWSPAHPGHATTFESADWAPTQWLSQVVLAAVDDRFGVAGLAWFSGLMFLGLAMTVYLVVRREASPGPSALIAILVLAACGPGMSLRPQVISFILAAVVTAVWRDTVRAGRLPWILLPLTWLWAMSHGMWPVAIVLGGVFLVGAALDHQLPRRRLLTIGAVFAVSCLLPALTPVGPRLLAAVLEVNSRRDYFTEWGAPDFGSSAGFSILILIGLTVGLVARAARASWCDLLLLLSAGALALYSLRTVPIAAVAIAPMTAAGLEDVIPPRFRQSFRRDRLVVIGAAVCALGVLAAFVPHTADKPAALDSATDRYLDALPSGTVVLDDMTTGSYLLWRHPDLDVFPHGYVDVYTDRELQTVAAVSRLEPGWIDDVRATRPDVAVLFPGSPIEADLTETYHWTVAFRSGNILVLRPPQAG
jgi:hypothetical protein